MVNVEPAYDLALRLRRLGLGVTEDVGSTPLAVLPRVPDRFESARDYTCFHLGLPADTDPMTLADYVLDMDAELRALRRAECIDIPVFSAA